MYVRLRETGLTNMQIADQLGVSEAAVRRGLRKANFNPHQLPTWFIEDMAVHLDTPIVIDHAVSGAGAVTADWHLPLTKFDLVNTFLDHAIEIGATNWLLVAGDWFNQDFWSQFDFKMREADVPTELRASTFVMERVLQVFDRVIISWGNHDSRLHKTLRYAVDFSTTMSWLFSDLDPELRRKLEFSNLDNVIVTTAERGDYYIAHPKSYNSKPLTTAIDLAAKELKHIITGHSHHTAIGHDRSGKFVVAEIGGFFDAKKTQYLQRTTKYPVWQNGYGFIDADGYLIVEAEGWSTRAGRKL